MEAEKKPYKIRITLRSGATFLHEMSPASFEGTNKAIEQVKEAMRKRDRNFLSVPHPLGIYRIEEVFCAHFEDLPEDVADRELGFLAEN